jgi:hypothetical protein
MRNLKMLGLAAVAAAALMALVGAGPASATVLCEGTPAAGTDCATKVASGSTLSGSLESGTSALLKGPFGETIATCTESTVSGPTSNTGSTTETVKGNITTLTFAKCNHPVTVKANGSLEAHYIAGTDNGIVTSTGATVIIDETLFGACQYATNATSIGTATGKYPSAGTFDLNAKISSENGCPQASLSGSYIGTGGTSANVAAG